MLTYHERKSRLPFGAAALVAESVGCARSNVAAVLKGVYRNREVERALSSLMHPRTTVTDAFGPPGPDERMRIARKRLRAQRSA